MKTGFCLCLALTAALSGCGILSNPNAADKLSDADLAAGDKAVVVFSTGIPESCGGGAKLIDLSFFASGASYAQDQRAATFTLNNHYLKSDFADHPGNLNAVALPPGDYQIAPFAPGIAGVNGGFTYTIRGTLGEIRRYDLHLAAGDVVYLGEYWMVGACDGVGRGSFRDQEQRDLQLLAEKNPHLAQARIVKNILEPAGYVDRRRN